TQRRHPTNMHLSAHRAIAVRDTLGSAGIDWNRMSVTGWGEYRPLVANNAGTGTAENRRVEIYLVPGTRGEVQPSAGNESGSAQPTPAETNTRPRIDPTK
ncbi:MAG: OmpA family protein, partial [Phycisphaerales bacterium]